MRRSTLTRPTKRSCVCSKRIRVRDREAAKEVAETPENYAPPALIAAAQVMFESDQVDESLFCYCLGYLRATSDSQKCEDPNARGVLHLLAKRFGPPFHEYLRKNPALRRA